VFGWLKAYDCGSTTAVIHRHLVVERWICERSGGVIQPVTPWCGVVLCRVGQSMEWSSGVLSHRLPMFRSGKDCEITVNIPFFQ
jgi:hypothetical protein